MKQDCVCFIAPFPFNDQPPEWFNPATDFDISRAGEIWYAWPQLFFTCLVCPRGQKANVTSHRKLSLVFFNTFDPIQLSPESVMHEKDIPMLCEGAQSQIPTMYICPVTNVLGRISPIPCYMDGQKHPTVPNRFRKSELGGAIADSRPDNGTYRFRKSELGGAIADSRPDNGTGSRLYELKVWLWNTHVIAACISGWEIPQSQRANNQYYRKL